MPEVTDHELMLQVRAGQQQALALLFTRHHRRLLNFFCRCGHAATSCEDLLQETFLRIMKYADSYREDGSFIAWLYQVARHAAIDSLPDKRECAEPDEGVEGWPDVHWHTPDARHEQQLLEGRVMKAMNRLPQQTRELILLSRVQEIRADQLAQMFEVPVGTLKVRLHRALQQLKQLLDQETDQPSRVEET